MKKLLLSLGTVAAIVAPVATVVACGKTTTTTTTTTPKGHMTPVAVTSSKDAATLHKIVQTEIKQNSDTVDHLDALLGIPKGKFSPMQGSTYVWNAQKLILTITKLVNGAPYGNIVTVTPTEVPEAPTTIKLGANQKVFALGFTFGVKDSDLTSNKKDFTPEFKKLLDKAGVADSAPVAKTITQQMSNEQRAKFTYIASSAILVISTDGKTPVDADIEKVVKAQLKLAGIERIFSHVQNIAPSTADVTADAKKLASGDTFDSTNKFAVVNNLKAIKSLYNH